MELCSEAKNKNLYTSTNTQSHDNYEIIENITVKIQIYKFHAYNPGIQK